MSPFQKMKVIRPSVKTWIQAFIKQGKTREEAKRTYREYGEAEGWQNDVYQVLVYRDYLGDINPKKFPGIIWLSIRRLDGEPVSNWRDFQTIKNELIGIENEFFQIFPAESRKIDDVNQYHLLGYADPSKQIQVGFGLFK